LFHPTNHKASTVATSVSSKLHVTKTDLSFSGTVLYQTKLTETKQSPQKVNIPNVERV